LIEETRNSKVQVPSAALWGNPFGDLEVAAKDQIGPVRREEFM